MREVLFAIIATSRRVAIIATLLSTIAAKLRENFPEVQSASFRNHCETVSFQFAIIANWSRSFAIIATPRVLVGPDKLPQNFGEVKGAVKVQNLALEVRGSPGGNILSGILPN